MAHLEPQTWTPRVALSRREYDASLCAVSGETTLVKRDRGPWMLQTLALDTVTLQVALQGGPNVFRGTVDEDRVGLLLVLPSSSRMCCRGKALDDRSLTVLRPRESFVTHSDGIVRQCLISVPVDRFLEIADRLDPARADELLDGSGAFDLSVEGRDRLMLCVRGALSSHLPTRSMRRVVESELVAACVLGVAGAASAPHSASRQELLGRIRATLERLSSRPASVQTLARHVGVSERTLRAVVREYYGVSPKQLLTALLLGVVRCDLRRAAPDASVGEIVMKHGVWELGRFAQRYRQLFGELPSETLASARSASRHPRSTRAVG